MAANWPFNLQNGYDADASQVMANLNYLYTLIAGGIDFGVQGIPSGSLALPPRFLLRGFTIANLGGTCDVQATSDFVFTHSIAGVPFMTVTFKAGVVAPVFSVLNYVIPDGGVEIETIGQSTPDATLTNPTWAFSP